MQSNKSEDDRVLPERENSLTSNSDAQSNEPGFERIQPEREHSLGLNILADACVDQPIGIFKEPSLSLLADSISINRRDDNEPKLLETKAAGEPNSLSPAHWIEDKMMWKQDYNIQQPPCHLHTRNEDLTIRPSVSMHKIKQEDLELSNGDRRKQLVANAALTDGKNMVLTNLMKEHSLLGSEYFGEPSERSLDLRGFQWEEDDGLGKKMERKAFASQVSGSGSESSSQSLRAHQNGNLAVAERDFCTTSLPLGSSPVYTEPHNHDRPEAQLSAAFLSLETQLGNLASDFSSACERNILDHHHRNPSHQTDRPDFRLASSRDEPMIRQVIKRETSHKNENEETKPNAEKRRWL